MKLGKADIISSPAGYPLTEAKINEILLIEKGKRPNPTEYLPKEYIDAHLSQFDDGAVRFFVPHKSGTIGPENAFVLPKTYVENLYKATEGNINLIEDKLGLPSGYLSYAKVAIIDKPNVKIPSGNEIGAHPDYWTPGGKTSGNVPEAIISEQLKESDVIIKNIEDLFNGK
ncbi:hypothetical protein FHQ30_09060 [Pasteurellaceae bacterium Phil11]|nr:hypothetical protein FHQ30_09060 [Pasteurellaceae bacterium Phil11]